MEHISPTELAESIKAGTHTNITIVDVRDEGFEDGHIIGAINAPSASFKEETFVDELIQNLAVDSSKTVVFHCMKSQHRGPTSAKIFADKLAALPEDSRPKVTVLTGGYAAFSELYLADEALIQKTAEN